MLRSRPRNKPLDNLGYRLNLTASNQRLIRPAIAGLLRKHREEARLSASLESIRKHLVVYEMESEERTEGDGATAIEQSREERRAERDYVATRAQEIPSRLVDAIACVRNNSASDRFIICV